VTSRGFCWNTTGDPQLTDSHIEVGSGTGDFTGSITGLTAGTKYYVRAYATNSVGTSYATEILEITTHGIPTVQTLSVDNIDFASAKAYGKVVSDGGATVTERGFCYATHDNPTTSDGKITSGNGLGNFEEYLLNLNPGQTYYVRAYAKNVVGTAYGNPSISFTTSVDRPDVVTVAVISKTSTTLTVKGRIDAHGGDPNVTRGICYKQTNTTFDQPLITDMTVQDSGTGLGEFTCVISNLQPNTRYAVRAYGINSSEFSPGYGKTIYDYTDAAPIVTTVLPPADGKKLNLNNQRNNDYTYRVDLHGKVSTLSGVDACHISYSENPDMSNPTDLVCTKALAFTKNTGYVLPENKHYFYQAWVTLTSGGNAYGNIESFYTTDLTTNEPQGSDLSDNSAHLSAVFTNGNDSEVFSITERGFYKSTGTSITYNDENKLICSGNVFEYQWTGLNPNTNYIIQAYVKTSDNRFIYGNKVTFTTKCAAVTVTTNPATNVSYNSAVINGTLSNAACVDECWFKFGTDTTSHFYRYDCTSVTTPFSLSMSCPYSGKRYYFQAWAKDSDGNEVYGRILYFTTERLVITDDASNIHATSAKLHGHAISAFGNVVECAFLLGTDSTDFTRYTLYSTANPFTLNTADRTTLSPNTTYYYQAWARNNQGNEGWGEVLQFKTLSRNDVTVCDDTRENWVVPICAQNINRHQRVQFVYSASLLSSLQNKNIEGLKFYMGQLPAQGWHPLTGNSFNCTFRIYMENVGSDELNGLTSEPVSGKVYEGDIEWDSNTKQVAIYFDQPFNYTGGNLKVYFETDGRNDDEYGFGMFYGIESYHKCYWGYDMGDGTWTYSLGVERNFLPKTTFILSVP